MKAFAGTNLKARALRGGALTIIQSQGENVFRLVSNLVLTRLLVPEAFGLMAIVQVFITGLTMFSDMGVRGSIIQNERGDEPEFLNTAWTLQIGRGAILWLGACLLSIPAAEIYGEPMLLQLLPVVAFSLVISGFQTTNYITANRHLELGRITAIDLFAQVAGLCVIIVLAILLRSVWALAIGTVIAALIKVFLHHLLLPGIRNRFSLERDSVTELIRFGKYIFLTSASAFLIRQSDRAILGAFLPLAVFGVYNIGWVMATVPWLMATALGNKVTFPLYGMRHPLESNANRQAMFRARRFITGGILTLNAILAYGAVWLVDLLYDERYALAGPVIVLMTTALVPAIVVEGTIRAAVAKGDSRSFFFVIGSTALCQVLLVYAGVRLFGIGGAVAGLGVGPLLTYPLRALIVHRYRSFDPLGEMCFMVLGLCVNLGACWYHRVEVIALLGAS